MRRIYKLLMIAAAAAGISACTLFAKKKHAPTDKTTTAAAIDLRNTMRKLFENDIEWTRNVLICEGSNAPGKNEALERLSKNEDDIVNLLGTYYTDAASRLSEPLHNRVALTATLVKEPARGKRKRKASADEEGAAGKWDENAATVAAYFSTANPAMKTDNLKNMMLDYMKLTKDEADARRNRDYKADVECYDKLHDASLNMADSLSITMVRQNPDKF